MSYLEPKHNYNELQVGLEAEANPFTMIAGKIKAGFMAIAETSQSAFNSFNKLFVSGNNHEQLQLTYNLVDTDKLTNTNETYIGVASLNIPVPKAFVGNYLEYTKFLSSSLSDYSSIDEEILDPIIEIINRLLVNPKEVSPTTLKIAGKLQGSSQIVKSDYASGVKKFFKKNGVDEVATFGKCFKNISEVQKFFTSCKDLVYVYNSLELKSIRSKVDKLSADSDKLYIAMKNNELDGLPNGVAIEVAEMLNLAAMHVELFGTILVYSEQLVVYSGNVHHRLTAVLGK